MCNLWTYGRSQNSPEVLPNFLLCRTQFLADWLFQPDLHSLIKERKYAPEAKVQNQFKTVFIGKCLFMHLFNHRHHGCISVKGYSILK